ncbi:MAG: oxidoreductase [Proteobacteria bacterium]|nr:oxidoreductase [Pseudomonadota bacterium]
MKMGITKTRWASLVCCGVFSWSLFFGHGSLKAQPANQTGWQQINPGVEASLRGLSVVDAKTVWCSGSGGTVIRTEDGGQTWTNVSVAEAPELDFRDIHAFDSRQAVILSAGQPARVYRTKDGGAHWQLAFEHPDKKSFFDALSFFDAKHGIAMSDPLDNRVLLIETLDGGHTWAELPALRRPPTERGEAGFAASGTNMRVIGDDVFIALGGAEENQSETSSRIVVSRDRAQTWQPFEVPMPRNPSQGIFSMVFANPKNVIVVGGDYLNQSQRTGTAAWSKDGGKTWSPPTGQPPGGYRSGVAAGQINGRTFLIAVGPEGTDVSHDMGQSWQAASPIGFHAVQFCPAKKTAWASGAEGAVGRWSGPPPAPSKSK